MYKLGKKFQYQLNMLVSTTANHYGAKFEKTNDNDDWQTYRFKDIFGINDYSKLSVYYTTVSGDFSNLFENSLAFYKQNIIDNEDIQRFMVKSLNDDLNFERSQEEIVNLLMKFTPKIDINKIYYNYCIWNIIQSMTDDNKNMMIKFEEYKSLHLPDNAKDLLKPIDLKFLDIILLPPLTKIVHCYYGLFDRICFLKDMIKFYDPHDDIQIHMGDNWWKTKFRYS